MATALADQERRVVAPYLRGFEPTRFHNHNTPRSGQVAALTQDLRDLLEALNLDRVTLVGQDWGARAAQGVAVVDPDKVDHLVCVGGYVLNWDQNGEPPSYRQIQALWYQFFLQTGWGEGMLHADPIGFSRHLWTTWSPTWADAHDAFAAAQPALQGDDFVQVVLSAYRGEPVDDRYDRLESHLCAGPDINVPTTLIYGADDGLEPDGPATDVDEARFTNLIEVRTIEGAGHFLHAERPQEVLDALASVTDPDSGDR